MKRRRAIALAILLPLLEPAAAGLSVWAASGPHECGDHACFCARRCPPKREDSDCHRHARSAVAMTGSCHRGEAPQLGAVTPYLLPEPVASSPAWREEPAARTVPIQALPGFSRIDSPPPRSL